MFFFCSFGVKGCFAGPHPPFDNSHYEKACDQAIAMCDGNLRSTIKALIMANEYLEAELTELQVTISAGRAPLTAQRGENSAA